MSPCGCNKAKEKAARMVHGAVGLAKAALGVDKADGATMAARLAICQDCEHAEKNHEGKAAKCNECGCRLIAKTSIQGESCPIGKW